MNNNNLSNELQSQILSYNFDAAKKIALNMSEKDLSDTLTSLAFEEGEGLLIYTFMVSLLLEKETAKYHLIASDVLSLTLCTLPGAHGASFFHARKSLELDPSNIEYKENVLFFYNLLSKEEAYTLAQEVIKVLPSSEVALAIIDKLKD